MKPSIYKTFPFINFFLSFLSFAIPTHSQSNGLEFYSHDVVQDKRTSLDLFPEAGYCFKHDFEISFDVAFLPERTGYFGYVFRLIKSDEMNLVNQR